MIASVAVIIIVLIALGMWRWNDKRVDKIVWARLAAHQPSAPGNFDISMIANLPEPARRYFHFSISPGTPLYTVAEITMQGQFSLGSKAKPNYMPMRAQQILAAPDGFVWNVHAGKFISISGSDGADAGKSWSRFWLFGIIPVARAGNSHDHARSAFGRYVAEAVFWTPAALLPGNNVHWEPVDDSTARVTIIYGELSQSVELSVDATGRLTRIIFQRWSDANATKVFQLQPFGGYLAEYKEFGGFRLPTRIDAGNYFETEDYFPFFRANVTSIRFPDNSQG